MRTKIVGVSHGDRQEILRRMKDDRCEGDWVYLAHDEKNEYDRNAVVIVNEDREILGYLKQDYSLAAVNRLKEGADGHAVILSFSGGDNGRHIGCNIDIPWLYIEEDEEIERILKKQEGRQDSAESATGCAALIIIGFAIWIFLKLKCL